MDPLTENERQKYQKLWTDVPDYRTDSPGEIYVSDFLRFFEKEMQERETLIDFGCGTGKVAKHFLEKGLFLTLVDFCENCLDEDIAFLTRVCSEQVGFVHACLWDLPKDLPAADWIYCCDVLEHIPEEKLDKVLQGMAKRTKKGGYLSIHLAEDVFGREFLGQPLHITIKDKSWWRKKLSKHWRIAHETALPGFEALTFNCCVIKK